VGECKPIAKTVSFVVLDRAAGSAATILETTA